MFCIKVPIGKERSLVRQYSSGFLPTYVPAINSIPSKISGTSSKIPGKVKKLIVPGFIFTLSHSRNAEKVEDWEWQLIEALSSTHPTTVNKRAQVVDGPLKGLDEYIANVDLKKGVAMIKARLLGKYRSYWINISTPAEKEHSTPAEKEKADDTQAANVVELKQTKGEAKKMAKATYTEEQINQAIELAKEKGVHAAARELSLPWQAVMSAAKKAGVAITPKVVKPKKAKKTASEPAAPAATTTPVAEEKPVEGKAGKKAEEKPAVEKPKRGRKKKAVYEVVDAAPTTPAIPATATTPANPSTPVEKKEEKQAEKPASALEIENAVLRKENEQLKAKIEKLQKALADLI